MSQITSSLGWKCDEDYFISEAKAILAGDYLKYAAGDAICAEFYFKSGNFPNYIPYIISTNRTAVITCNRIWQDIPYEQDIDSATINNKTWWIKQVAGSTGWKQSSFPTINMTAPSEASGKIQAILTAASVEIVNIIPTTTYVKTFIEGVEVKTVEKINALKAMVAPAFDSTTSYAVNDITIYNDKLYKCTTAHSGAWDNNNFQETTIIQLLNNL